MSSNAIPISETFVSLQGEGQFAGQPSLFIRTSGCNLRCSWCDTPYTSWEPETKTREVYSLAREIMENSEKGIRHVVITGGEPALYRKQLTEVLMEVQHGTRHHPIVTVETNGTIAWMKANMLIHLFSVSPKLDNSVPENDAAARERHIRENNPQWRFWIGTHTKSMSKVQLKFVIRSQEDIDEVEHLREFHNIPDDMIWLMPEGRTAEEVQQKMKLVMDNALKHRWNACTRLQTLAWGQRRGV